SIDDCKTPEITPQVKVMFESSHTVANARALVVGFTFKEICPNLPDTREIDVVKWPQKLCCQVNVTDCLPKSDEAGHEYDICLTGMLEHGRYSGVIVAVPNKKYAAMSANYLQGYLKANGIMFDFKGAMPLGEAGLQV